jgi:hypothetical protein
VVSNDGTETITFQASATDSIAVGYPANGELVDNQVVFADDNRTATETFRLKPGTPPGDYFFSAATGSTRRVAVLAVRHAPSRGAITGNVRALDQDAVSPFGGTADLELYGTDGKLVQTGAFRGFGSPAYVLPFVEPGTYRVRWTPADTNLVAQWWPNADAFERAADVVVGAGKIAGGIDFLVDGPTTEALAVVIPVPVPGDAGTLRFPLSATAAGRTYILESSPVLGGTWTESNRTVGDGAPKSLVDTTGADATRFYRLRVE